MYRKEDEEGGDSKCYIHVTITSPSVTYICLFITFVHSLIHIVIFKILTIYMCVRVYVCVCACMCLHLYLSGWIKGLKIKIIIIIVIEKKRTKNGNVQRAGNKISTE